MNQLKSKRVLVTGGAGFIGSHLVDELVLRGQPVTVLDNFSAGQPSNLVEAAQRGDVRVIRGSILDVDALQEALESCDTVYHLAVECVRRSLGDPIHNHDVNATGTLNVLELSRKQGSIQRFIYCSSSEVYGNGSSGGRLSESSPCEPVTVYGAAKLAGEYYAKAYFQTYQLPTVVVRPFNAYGPREHDSGDLAEVIPRFVIRVLNGLPPVIFGTGGNGRDFTYVKDTARALVLAAECDDLLGNVVNVARGELVTVAELAKSVARLCQRPDLKPILAPPRPGDVRVLHADTSRADALLRFRPETGIEEGLERYISWFTNQYPDPSELLEDDPINWKMPA
jgi:UDP-glucose 4-epimerase